MSEYIDRAALKQELAPYEENDFSQQMDVILAIVDAQPTADVVEVRHGHWIDLNAENSTGPLFKCSECSHLHNPNRNDLDLERVELNPLYCDACGARMGKEDEHEVS